MPGAALTAGGLSLVGKALASISPNLVVASSAAVQLFSWLQLAKIPLSAAVASVAILMLIPMHYNVLYGVLTSTNTKDIDQYTSKGITGFPNKKISWFDKIKVRKRGEGLVLHPVAHSARDPLVVRRYATWPRKQLGIRRKEIALWRERKRGERENLNLGLSGGCREGCLDC